MHQKWYQIILSVISVLKTYFSVSFLKTFCIQKSLFILFISHLWFAGVRECPPWCSIVGATVTVHQFFCILHWYYTCAFLVTRPLTLYHNFWPSYLQLAVWLTFDKLWLLFSDGCRLAIKPHCLLTTLITVCIQRNLFIKYLPKHADLPKQTKLIMIMINWHALW